MLDNQKTTTPLSNNGLLKCGILSTILYIGTDILLSFIYPGYSYRDQAISELSAVGAPTRPMWIAMTFLFNPLLVAFGIGVYKAFASKRMLHITGILLTIWGFLGFVWLFFPMHMRGSIGSVTDTMHLVMAALTVTLIVSFIICGSGTQGRWFCLYSYLTILIMLVFGTLTSQQAPRVATQLSTEWMGITERISVYFPMLWVSVLAITLLKNEKEKNNIY